MRSARRCHFFLSVHRPHDVRAIVCAGQYRISLSPNSLSKLHFDCCSELQNVLFSQAQSTNSVTSQSPARIADAICAHSVRGPRSAIVWYAVCKVRLSLFSETDLFPEACAGGDKGGGPEYQFPERCGDSSCEFQY